MTTSEGLIRKKDNFYKSLTKAKERKVDIKIAAPINKGNVEHAKELAKIAEGRNTEINSRFCLVDGDKIVFMLLDDADLDPNYDVGIWAETKPFLSGIKALFESNWSNMKPVSQVKV